MAYARFTKDSEVYVYADERGGYTCLKCPGRAFEFHCATAAEMVAHLEEHRANGVRVPADAIDQLRVEAEED